MPTTQAPDPAYTLEQAQGDIAGLRNQLALQQDIISTVSDKALLLYAPDAHAIPRGPTSWSFEDGTVQGWAAANGAVTNSVVTAAGWPTDGTHSLLLTANGAGTPNTFSPTSVGNFIPSQPGDIVAFHADIYCPAALNHVYVGIKWRDDTGALISETDGPDTVFGAGQVQTLYWSGTAPDLTAGFAIVFGDHNTDANGTLMYIDNIQVLGNLAISASPGGGTDPAGNPYDAGFEVQVEKAGAFRVRGVNGQIITMQVVGGVPLLTLATGVSEEGSPANVQAQVNNPGASETMFSAFRSPRGTVHTDVAGVILNSAAKDGSLTAGGDLYYQTTGGVVQLPLVWGKNGVRLNANGISGDSNTYQAERATVAMPSNGAVTINQTVFSQQLCGAALALGVGNYHVHGQILVSPNQAAGAAQFEFTGGAAVASMRIAFTEYNIPNAATGVLTTENAGQITGFVQAFTGNTFGALDRLFIFDGTINCTTAGQWALLAATTVAIDTYVVRGLGTYMELSPIGP